MIQAPASGRPELLCSPFCNTTAEHKSSHPPSISHQITWIKNNV